MIAEGPCGPEQQVHYGRVADWTLEPLLEGIYIDLRLPKTERPFFMAMPVLPPQLISQLSVLVAQYISGQRAKYLPTAVLLSKEQKTAMEGFFTSELLDGTRLLTLIEERVVNPDFYPMLVTLGFTNLPDQSKMAAITFSDTVVAHVPFNNDLLFHELVHVEQYRQLGIATFAELYVRGFLSGGGYEGIPLEQNAYSLEARYAHNPATSFSVADEVATWIAEKRF